MKYVAGWSPAWVSLLINIPLFLLGWKFLGRASLFYTFIGMLSLSLFLWVFTTFRMPLKDPLLAALYGGASVGLGLGIVFRFEGTTDGMDILAKIFQRRFGWSIGRTILITDAIVLGLSLVDLDLTRAMYTMVSLFVGARVIDFVIEGSDGGRAAIIVTHHPQKLSVQIMQELGRGVTFLEGKGGYSGVRKEVIYCVVERKEMPRLKALVHQIDQEAFVSFSEVQEVIRERVCQTIALTEILFLDIVLNKRELWTCFYEYKVPSLHYLCIF